MDRLHAATRAVIDAPDPDAALTRAVNLATDPPPDWDSREWLSIAAAANASASTNPRWFKVKALASEKGASNTAATDALWARAHLLMSLGVDESDGFRSMSAFVERASTFLRSDVPDAALASYQAARSTILTTEQGTPVWLEARDTFLRCRRLRELGRIASALSKCGHMLPPQIQRWTSWADLREEDLMIVGS